jgi:hypothetical protein
VLLDGKAIDINLINTVKTEREFNKADMATISLNWPYGEIPFRLRQIVQIDLTSRGGTIFAGYLYGLDPAKGSYGNRGLVLRCRSSAFPPPSTFNPDSAFPDVIQEKHIVNRSSDDKSDRSVGLVMLNVKYSVETTRVLYDLNWPKKITFDGYEGSIQPYLRDGVFNGFIISVDRTYSWQGGPELSILLSSERQWYPGLRGNIFIDWRRNY